MKHSAKYLKSKLNKLYAAATLLFIAGAAFGLLCGSTDIDFASIISAIKNGAVGAEEKIFLYVRLPRTLGCLTVGAALSVAGGVIQSVLANRLASPSIIGVNSGAGLAVTLCTAMGLYGGWQLSAFSFLGAFVAVMLISTGAQKWGASRGTVILMGVAMNSIFNAFSDTIITLNPNVGVMSNDFKIGDFSSVTYIKLVPVMIVVIISICVLLTLTNELDILTLGEESARGLGLNTRLMRTLFLIIAALLSGCSVCIAGLLSFVGLIVPHAIRRFGVFSAGNLLPLCALFGGGFVAICDTVSRTVFAPYEIPVGIIMAFLGAPFFIFILIKGKGGHSDA